MGSMGTLGPEKQLALDCFSGTATCPWQAAWHSWHTGILLPLSRLPVAQAAGTLERSKERGRVPLSERLSQTL